MVTVGNNAPNFDLCTMDGSTVSLHETLRSGQHVLLVFLRHLG
jgi:peroxiredoxin